MLGLIKESSAKQLALLPIPPVYGLAYVPDVSNAHKWKCLKQEALPPLPTGSYFLNLLQPIY